MIDELESVIEFRDPAIDAEAVMRAVRESVRKHRREAEAQGLDYESFVKGLYAATVSARFHHEFYSDLRRLGQDYNKVAVGLSLTENQWPLIGSLIRRVRVAMHRLVLYYVNMMVEQQMAFNEGVVRTLTRLVQDLEGEPSPSKVKMLQEQVNALQAQVRQLEEALGQSGRRPPNPAQVGDREAGSEYARPGD